LVLKIRYSILDIVWDLDIGYSDLNIARQQLLEDPQKKLRGDTCGHIDG
jgi:hypothetical protein